MDDHEIVDLYWQRDEHAIEATAAKYESYCMKISQNILSDRADSEENVNDTYLHAWQAMPLGLSRQDRAQSGAEPL